MEKLVYLFWGRSGSPNALRGKLLGECAPQLLDAAPGGISILVDDEDSTVSAPMPWPDDELPLCAVVSVWLDCYDRREACEQVLAQVGERRAGYLVTESLYTDYGGNRWSEARDWPDGARSPGVVMVTLLERPERMARQEWLTHWHGVQSPVSEAMQPRMRYVRNAVSWPVTEAAPAYEGIVEEAWPSARHLEDPMLFYCADGSEQTMKRNMRRMLESVQGFLDLPRIRSATLSEYLVRS